MSPPLFDLDAAGKPRGGSRAEVDLDAIPRTAATKAKAEQLYRGRVQRRELASRYDWYGDECSCGKPLGECQAHPRARPSQRPPGSYRASDASGAWRVWLMTAGRGFGKSRSASEFMVREIESGRVKWAALVGATVGDVSKYQIHHPYSGLIAISPPWFKAEHQPSYKRVMFPNGIYASIYTAEEPEELRGFGGNFAWVDELAKWQHNQQSTWDMLQFGMREISNPRPRIVVSTTPRPTPTFLALRNDKETISTGGPMSENAVNLDPTYIDTMNRIYAGTRLGRQELNAEVLEDTPGALWTNDLMAAAFIEWLPHGVELVEVVVGVDPAAGTNDPENTGAETGIVVGARGSDGLCYILADRTIKGSPDTWGSRAVIAYDDFQGSWIVGEINNGGAMVEHVIQTVAERLLGYRVPYETLWASRGKVTRAEPVAGLYEQGRVKHVGRFPVLEQQCCSWVPGEVSPDRMDALVWVVTKLMLGGMQAGQCESGGPPAAGARGGGSGPLASPGVSFGAGGGGLPGLFG